MFRSIKGFDTGVFGKINKNSILFWIAILGFFGITGLDLLNTIAKLVNELNFKPGYDGVYGEIVLNDKEKIGKNKSLSEF